MNILGRNRELGVLHNAWSEVKSGKGPQFVVIVAESGYGKTALVQEFYRRIALEENGVGGGGYWPDSMDNPEVAGKVFKNNLSINPELSPQWPPPPPLLMPWMWLGMRWANPLGRNLQSDDCALLHNSGYLEAHCQPALVARLKRINATKVLKELGKNTIGLVPIIGQLAGTVFSWYEIGKKLPHWIEAVGAKAKSPAAAFGDSKNTIKEAALGYLRTFVDPGDKDLPTVPFILVLDDAQWADANTLQFVYEAYNLCLEKRWPLFVLATFWEQEWLKGADLPIPTQDRRNEWKHLRQIAAVIEHDLQKKSREAKPENVIQELRLVRLSEGESHKLLHLHFPNLGPEAGSLILERSGGNPLHLSEYISILDSEARRRSWWFEGKNPECPLTKSGLEALRNKTTTREDVIRTRLDQIMQESPSVVEVLKLASVQGTIFSVELLADVAKYLEQRGEDIKLTEPAEAMEKAQNPFAIIARTDPVVYEFRHHSYWRQFFDMWSKDEQEEVESALADVLVAWANAGKIEKDMKSVWLYQLLQLFGVKTSLSHIFQRAAGISAIDRSMRYMSSLFGYDLTARDFNAKIIYKDANYALLASGGQPRLLTDDNQGSLSDGFHWLHIVKTQSRIPMNARENFYYLPIQQAHIPFYLVAKQALFSVRYKMGLNKFLRDPMNDWLSLVTLNNGSRTFGVNDQIITMESEAGEYINYKMAIAIEYLERAQKAVLEDGCGFCLPDVKTVSGQLIAHESRDLVEAIAFERECFGNLRPDRFGIYSAFCTYSDFPPTLRLESTQVELIENHLNFYGDDPQNWGGALLDVFMKVQRHLVPSKKWGPDMRWSKSDALLDLKSMIGNVSDIKCAQLCLLIGMHEGSVLPALAAITNCISFEEYVDMITKPLQPDSEEEQFIRWTTSFIKMFGELDG